jgi:hypothetical protein
MGAMVVGAAVGGLVAGATERGAVYRGYSTVCGTVYDGEWVVAAGYGLVAGEI